MDCENCGHRIDVGDLYIHVKKFIPNNVRYTPEDVAERGIHVHCILESAAAE